MTINQHIAQKRRIDTCNTIKQQACKTVQNIKNTFDTQADKQ
jgi:hypothetical protein